MTQEQKSGLARLICRLPQRRRELENAADEWIFEVYGDYERATRACLHWTQRLGPSADALADAFRRIVVELEEEISAAVAE
jgi:hypothetical protein